MIWTINPFIEGLSCDDFVANNWYFKIAYKQYK